MKKNLLLSSLPPEHCGIAKYAYEQLISMREEGMDVVTMSPSKESDCDICIDPTNVTGCLNWLMRVIIRKYDLVTVHYTDNYFFPFRIKQGTNRKICRFLQGLALRMTGKSARYSTMVIHELAYQKELPKVHMLMRGLAFSGFDEIQFHTESMRMDCLESFPELKKCKTTVVDHARYMRKRFFGSKENARMELGLPLRDKIFLCIGFLNHAKGFDEAMEAFLKANIVTGGSMIIVGSVQNEKPSARAYVNSLLELSESSSCVILREEFVNDDTFDTYLAASDVVILPYRGVASSGVGERAGLYGKKVIARNLPSLQEQFPDAEFFDNLDDLVEIIKDIANQ